MGGQGTCCLCCCSFCARHRRALGAERAVAGLLTASFCTGGLTTAEVEATAAIFAKFKCTNWLTDRCNGRPKNI